MKNDTQVTLEDAYLIAQKHHQGGNLTLADRTYRDILITYPDDFNSLFHLGILAYQQGNLKEGVEILERAIAVDDTSAECWNAYASMQGAIGLEKNAIESFEKALSIHSDFPDALSNMGHAYWKLGQYDEAIAVCKKAIKLRPDFSDAYVNLGAALTGIDEKEKAIEAWQKALEITPNHPNALINIGNGLRDLGKISEAAEYCEKSLEFSPNHPQALVNYANVLRDQGKFKEAEETYRKAIHNNPKFIDAHNNLSVVLMDQLKFEEAAGASRFALAFDENNVKANTQLASALREQGRLAEAEAISRQALKLDPESGEARIDLADILFLSDRYAEAETLLQEAMEKIPDDPRLYLKLSAFLERSGDIDAALDATQKAIELSPEMPDAYHRLAMIFFMDNKIKESLEALDKALKLKPKFPIAMGTKSELLQSHGDMEGARKAAEDGLEINPNMAFLYYSLSKVKKFTKDDEHLKKMEELSVKENTMGIVQSTALFFALFKAYEDIGDYEKSFAALKKGNDLKRSSVVFDKNLQNNAFAKVKSSFTKESLSTFKGKGCQDDTPIFIIGMPRSGTTLTEQIISSHPKVFGAGELYFLSNLEKQLDPLTPDNAKEWGETYLKHARAIHPDAANAEKITDKMPGNYMRLGQIIATLPNAKIIHCRRDPIDTSLSCYKQLFSRSHYWTYNLDDLAEHYALYADMMEYWRKEVGNKFIEIHYEDTVNDFENQARMLIDHVGLEWDDACLTPHKTKRSILTASKGQVRKPIYKTSVEAWRRYEEQLSDFANKLEPYARKKAN